MSQTPASPTLPVIAFIGVDLLTDFGAQVFAVQLIGVAMFREFAVVLSMTIAVSAFVSLTLTPMMASRLLKAHDAERHGRLYRMSEAAFDWLLAVYADALDVALRFRRVTLLVFFATLALTGYLFVVIPKGFFPQQDTGRLIGFIRADQATSFQAMRGIASPPVGRKIVRLCPAGFGIAPLRRQANCPLYTSGKYKLL